MYHRILPKADPRYATEEPGMVVTPDTFRDHLRFLGELFEFMSLNEWQQRARDEKSLPAKACAITFDDGWSDNYQYALPILQERDTPAHLFAVADMIGTNRMFWPNRVARILLEHNDELAELADGKWLQHNGSQPPNRETVAAVISECKNLSDNEVESRLDELEGALGINHNPGPALMSWQQLGDMAAQGLVEIGSHTCNHQRLITGVSQPTLEHEIVDSKAIIQSKLGCEINSFCYPNGDHTPEAEKLVRQHYSWAVTTRRGPNNAQSDCQLLTRFGVHENISDTRTKLLARISGWQ
jgi:peptidoglycan/xylan/chitin deacetylase (PgdA/CDA1 family)